MKRSIEVLTILLPMLFPVVWAEAASTRNGAKTVAASCPDSSPVIDGVLDEPCWAVAEVATDFIDYKTERPAREQTRVRVLYDDTYIYFGFECLEPEPGKIVAVERKYDQSLEGEDRVEIRLDTFHDLRRAYVFAVNTFGTRYDARMGLFQFDDSWGCDWKAACTVAEDRWFAEIAIPIGNLLFPRKDGVVWGCNFRRVEHGLQENSYWCYRNSQARYPREFGTITGLDLSNVKVDRQPRVETYVSSTYDVDEGSGEFSTGADVSIRLSSELTSAFTINPDFGQVEADPDTIELRDTERFLRERRTFFREGSELFDTPVSIYYSRRFQKIDAGGKVTGQGKDWALGLVDVQGDIERQGEMHQGNYHVGRFIHDAGEHGHIGGTWATSFRENGNNLTGGVDSRLFFDSTTSLTTQILGLSDSEGIETGGTTDGDAYAAYASLNGGTQPFWWGVNVRDISRGFRPDLGYVPRRDIRGPGSFLNYRQNLDSGSLKWISLGSEARLYENNDHDTTLRDFDESAGVCLRNEIELWYYRKDRFRDPYQNWSDRIVIEYNEEVDIWNSVSVGVERGEYELEPYVEYSLDKPQRINDRLATTVGGNYRQWTDREEDDTAWLWRSVTQYNFSWKARIKFTAEQTSEGRHNLTTLFSWPVRKQIDLYVLWNDYETGDEDVNSVFAKVVYRF
jgi:hypothetical protein